MGAPVGRALGFRLGIFLLGLILLGGASGSFGQEAGSSTGEKTSTPGTQKPAEPISTEVTFYAWLRHDAQFATQEIRLERFGPRHVVVRDTVVLANQKPAWLIERRVEYRRENGRWSATRLNLETNGNHRWLRGTLQCKDSGWVESYRWRPPLEGGKKAGSEVQVDRTHPSREILWILPEHLTVVASELLNSLADGTSREVMLPLTPRGPLGPIFDGDEPRFEIERQRSAKGVRYEFSILESKESKPSAPRPTTRRGQLQLDSNGRAVELRLQLGAPEGAAVGVRDTALRIVRSTRAKERAWREQHEPKPDLDVDTPKKSEKKTQPESPPK